MVCVLAHDEAGSRLGPAFQDGTGTRMAVGDPHLSRPGTVDEADRQGAFALIGVLARHPVDREAAVGIVDHQGLGGQGRAAMAA